MADSTSVSIGFNTKEAQQEIKSLGNAMKQTQNEFKITDTTLKTTGSTVDRLKNKQQSLSTQLKQQSQITSKYRQMIEQASASQEAARKRLEKANAAYEKGKSTLKGNSEELQKLKNEVQKAQSAVNSADKSYEKWNNQLSKSKLAEANLRNELEQTSDELKNQSRYIAQVQEKYNQLNEKTADIQKGLTSTGKVLTATVTAPIVAASAYAVKSFKEVDVGLDIVKTKTGATGEQAKELQNIYEQVAKTIPAEFNDIGAAVGEINTRLDFTGDKLETASEDFLKFARVNGSDVNNSVQLVTRAMGDASIPADQYKSVLDAVTVAAQKSGVSIESLTSNLTKYGAPMRALGLDISDSIALFAAWEKSGVNTEIAFSGMKKAISNWGKEGKDSRVEFEKTLQDIKSAPDIASATTKAIAAFGSKAGPDLADAIKGGRFEVSAYMEALENADGTVDNTYATIVDGADDTKLAAQKIQVALSNLGEQIMQSGGPAILSLAEDASTLIEKFGQLDEGTQKNILRFALFAAAAGPVLSIASKGIQLVNGGIAVFSKLGVLFGGTASAAAAAETATAAVGAAATTAGSALANTGSIAMVSAAELESAGATIAGAGAGIGSAIGGITLAFGGTYAAARIASESIEKHRKKLQTLGDEAQTAADKVRETDKALSDIKARNKALDDYIAEYRELQNMLASGEYDAQTEAEYQSRIKEIEQWIIDNYGNYITAEEMKNGIRKESIDYLHDLSEAQKAQAEAEKAAAVEQARSKVSEGIEKTPEIIKNINEAQAKNTQYKQQAEDAGKLSAELAVLQNKFNEINASLTGDERKAAVKKLQSDNRDIAESYEKIVGGTLDYNDLSGAISNAADKAGEAADKVRQNTEDIAAYRNSLEGYKDAAIISIENQFGTTLGEAAQANAEKVKTLTGALDELEKTGGLSDGFIQAISERLPDVSAGLEGAADKAEYLRQAIQTQETDGLKEIEQALTDIFRALQILPEGQTVKLNDDGSIAYVQAGAEDIKNRLDELNSKKVNVVLNADGTPALAVIDGVTYKLKDYDKTTGQAKITLQDGTTYILDTATKKIIGFNNIYGEAEITAEDKTDKGVESAKKNIETVKDKEVKITVAYKTKGDSNLNKFYTAGTFPDAKPQAKGTQNFSGGLAMINDEQGAADPRELVEHKGKYYLFNGRNVILPLDPGDKVFTAAQTKQIMSAADIPHYATGTNNKSFTYAKEDFEYRQKTSVVTDAEALLWWKNILEEYASDTDIVKEASIEIYELTNKINKNAISDYKNRISKQESASKDWIDYEIKMNDLSADEQIAAYNRMSANYLSTLIEMQENTVMTEDELKEVWDDYYEKIRSHETAIEELRKQKLEEYNKLSNSYVSDRTYYNDWGSFSDDPTAAYERIKERNQQYLQEGIITGEEFNSIMEEQGKQLYEGRLANSEKWLKLQKQYGNISDDEYRQGLQRIKKYTEQYGQLGIISGQYYSEAIDSINESLFDNSLQMLNNYVDEYYSAQKDMINAKREAIEAEYDAQEKAESKAERKKQLGELTAQYEKYKNAVTTEGKKKVQEIQDSIDSLNKEERKVERDEEKQAKLQVLEQENKAIEKEQADAIKSLNKYTAQALGIISGGNDEMTTKFNNLVESYNNQQMQLAQEGYNTISKIVDMTNIKLAEIGRNIPVQSAGGGEVKVTVTQTFNNNINDEVSAMAYGKYAGSSVRNLDLLNYLVGNGD